MKQTIAERKVAGRKRAQFLPLLLCLPFGFIFYVCKYASAGYGFTALVCLCIIGLILFYTLMPVVGSRYPGFARTVTRCVSCILAIGLIIVGVTEGIIIHASLGNPGEHCDYMVVLGAKVRRDGPSVSLQDRINAAYDYMTEHPDVIAVVSGGQGPDEHITEAQCMFNELTAMGISPQRIWMEPNATTTWENIHFSLDLIEEKTGHRPEKLGVISSEYHLFRASLFTRACNVSFVGIPAHTSQITQLINHFMREVAGVWHYILLGGTY